MCFKSAAFRSGAVVLLFAVPHICLWETCVWSLFCYALLSLLPDLAVYLTGGGGGAGCFTLFVFLVSCSFFVSVCGSSS